MNQLRRASILAFMIALLSVAFLSAQCSSSQDSSSQPKKEAKKEEPKEKAEEPTARKRSLDLGQEVIDRLNSRLAEMGVGDYAPYATKVTKTQLDDLIGRVQPVLKEVLGQVPAGFSLQVTGHANPNKKHPESFWVDLSKRRAQKVHDHLTSKGIPGNKLSVKGLGSSEPAVDGWSPKNRRVSFKIVRN